MNIGKKLRLARQSNGLTLEDVAQKLGVSRQTVQRYESGAIKNIPNDKLELLGNLLNISADYLICSGDYGEIINSHKNKIYNQLIDAENAGLVVKALTQDEINHLENINNSTINMQNQSNNSKNINTETQNNSNDTYTTNNNFFSNCNENEKTENQNKDRFFILMDILRKMNDIEIEEVLNYSNFILGRRKR